MRLSLAAMADNPFRAALLEAFEDRGDETLDD